MSTKILVINGTFVSRLKLKKNKRYKLFCVGDDWQSIMAFAGSDIDLFVNFHDYFAKPARTDLAINYRSAKRIVDTGHDIIKHNGNAQLQKSTIAFSKLEGKVVVFSSNFPVRKRFQ
jgi:DNA helicase IV